MEHIQDALLPGRNAFSSYFLEPYVAAYYINIKDSTWQIYKRPDKIAENYPVKEKNYFASLGRYINTEIHPDDREGMLMMIQPETVTRMLSTQQSFSYTFRKISEEKERLLQCVFLRGADENHVILAFKDVSEEERKKKEFEASIDLANQQRHIRAFSDMINAALWSIEINSKDEIVDVYWSDAFRHKFGFENIEDFPNTVEAWADRLHPDDKEETLEHFWNGIKSKDTNSFVYEIKYRIRRKTGEYCWYHAVGRMENTDNGTRRMYGVIIDISADKKLEEAFEKINQLFKDNMQSSESQDKAIRQFMDLMINSESEFSVNELVKKTGQYFNADRAYIFEKDSTGQQVVNTYEWCADGVSPEIENLQEVPVHVIDPWIDEFRKKGSFYISCNNQYAKKEPMVYEVLEPQGITSLMAAPLVHRGDIIGFLGVDNPRDHVEHELYLSVAASVINHEILAEDQRRIEEEYKRALQKSSEEAQAANSAKTSFLFNMSHDIRTPINAIMGFCNLMERHQEDPEKRKDYLGKIEEASNVLLSIINNVLEMARIEKGTLKLDNTTVCIEEFADKITTVFQEMMDQKNIHFSTIINVRNHYVLADETKLREIVYNLLSNACKYTRQGGSVDLMIEELPCDRDGWAIYQTRVKDTGIGMSEEFLEHIYDEFSRENNTTEGKIEGTGLGMPIVKRFVDLMDGTIEVYSKRGEGSEFVVTIPHKISDLAEKPQAVEQNIPEAQLSGKRILLAEDNDINAEIAMELLKEEGMIVERAEDGRQCVDMLAKSEPNYYDIILMDIQMPNMNGYEAAKAIRALEDEQKKNIKIMAMTANAFEEDKKAAFQAGMNGHLAKPINIPELMSEIAKLLIH